MINKIIYLKLWINKIFGLEIQDQQSYGLENYGFETLDQQSYGLKNYDQQKLWT